MAKPQYTFVSKCPRTFSLFLSSLRMETSIAGRSIAPMCHAPSLSQTQRTVAHFAKVILESRSKPMAEETSIGLRPFQTCWPSLIPSGLATESAPVQIGQYSGVCFPHFPAVGSLAPLSEPP